MESRISNLENLIAKDYDNIAGIVVLRKGKIVYESYFDGFTSKDTVHITSVTKSIISALIGIAIDKGHIKSADLQ